MTRRRRPIVAGAAVLVFGFWPAPRADAQDASLSGRWSLNRALSELPRDVGFGADWLAAAGGTGGGGQSSGGGGRGRRGSSGGGSASSAAPFMRRESPDDAKRLRLLTAEVREPAARLTIADSATAVAMTDERGRTRTLHPDGKEESLQVGDVPVGIVTRREAGRLVVTYHVEQDRELRYTYSRTASPPQLVVEVQFIERGGGDKVRRVYDLTTGAETEPAVEPPPAAPPPTQTPGAPTPPGQTRADQKPAETFDAQPGAELKGLKNLGLLVEDLSATAAACGLSHDTIEAALSQRLTDAGFIVRRNSDEDTYVYVNIITSSLSTGLCVSRYDAFVYTHTTAKLSYQERPVLVQVSLLHRGGIAGGAPATHAAAVLRGLQEYVDLFSTQIHNANK